MTNFQSNEITLIRKDGKGEATIHIVKNDIVDEKVDAITNPTNGRLRHYGGIAKKILRHAGPSIEKESNEYIAENREIYEGGVAATKAGKLPSKYIIH